MPGVVGEIRFIFVMQSVGFFVSVRVEAEEEEVVFVFVVGMVEMGGNESWVLD